MTMKKPAGAESDALWAARALGALPSDLPTIEAAYPAARAKVLSYPWRVPYGPNGALSAHVREVVRRTLAADVCGPLTGNVERAHVLQRLAVQETR
jgi:hypothetical protein